MARNRNDSAAEAQLEAVQLIEPVDHDGVRSEPGDWLTVPPDVAAGLVASGAARSKAAAEALRLELSTDVSQSS